MWRGSDDQIIENVETFVRTFPNGGYDVEFDNALSSDRGITLPAQPTQALISPIIGLRGIELD
jgi:hypothetical protein